MLHRLKQPRMFHLPWSEGVTSDDKVMPSLQGFKGKRIQISLKMDGETTSGYADGFTHARSVDGGIKDEGQAWFRNYWQSIAFSNFFSSHIKGESLYWQHSIPYTPEMVPHTFLGFAAWHLQDNMHWILTNTDYTKLLFVKIGIHHVPIVYEGDFNQRMLERFHETLDLTKVEGYVVRVTHDVVLDDFPDYIGKFVRKDHGQTDQNWRKNLIPNNLNKE